jgi:hypothetical protein
MAPPYDLSRYLSTGDRQVGVPVVGEKPGKSPGDTSDLPPIGKELMEGAKDDKLSRFERTRRTAESQEILSLGKSSPLDAAPLRSPAGDAESRNLQASTSPGPIMPADSPGSRLMVLTWRTRSALRTRPFFPPP